MVHPGHEKYGHKSYPEQTATSVISTAEITKKATDVPDKGEPEYGANSITNSVIKTICLKCLAFKRSWGGKSRKEKWVKKVLAAGKSNDDSLSVKEKKGSN